MTDQNAAWRIDRSIPIGAIIALAVQSAGVAAWAGAASERIAAVERRLDRQAGVAERLARLEAQADASRASLARIEAKLDREETR